MLKGARNVSVLNPKSLKTLLQTADFGVIVTELGGSLTLSKLLLNVTQMKKEEWFQTVFQVAWGIYVLQLAGVSHNDFHSGNVLIKRLSAPTVFCLCKTEPVTYYTFSTGLHAQIYDFDRASWSEGAANRDLYKLVLTLLYKTRHELSVQRKYVQPLADLLFPKENITRLRELLELSRTTYFLKRRGQPLPEEVFEAMRPVRDILNDLAALSGVRVSSTKPEKVTKVYYVSADVFTNRGVKTVTVADSRFKVEVTSMTDTDVRDMEVALAQEEYDLAQLKYRALK